VPALPGQPVTWHPAVRVGGGQPQPVSAASEGEVHADHPRPADAADVDGHDVGTGVFGDRGGGVVAAVGDDDQLDVQLRIDAGGRGAQCR